MEYYLATTKSKVQLPVATWMSPEETVQARETGQNRLCCVIPPSQVVCMCVYFGFICLL